jgi:hypothetical protein
LPAYFEPWHCSAALATIWCSGATVMVRGQLIGAISSPQFAEAMLATFLGAEA